MQSPPQLNCLPGGFSGACHQSPACLWSVHEVGVCPEPEGPAEPQIPWRVADPAEAHSEQARFLPMGVSGGGMTLRLYLHLF